MNASNKLAEEMDGKPASITFTLEKREQLRTAYDEAVDNNDENFMFDGNEYVVGYAKYLLEYLDMVLVA